MSEWVTKIWKDTDTTENTKLWSRFSHLPLTLQRYKFWIVKLWQNSEEHTEQISQYLLNSPVRITANNRRMLRCFGHNDITKDGLEKLFEAPKQRNNSGKMAKSRWYRRLLSLRSSTTRTKKRIINRAIINRIMSLIRSKDKGHGMSTNNLEISILMR